MKNHQASNQVDKQRLIHYLEKATESLLNLFSFFNLTPLMIEVTNIIDYARNMQRMLLQLSKTLPKVCVPPQVFRKLEAESIEKAQKIHKLLQSQKNLKIQLKVFEQKNHQLQLKLNEKEAQSSRQYQVSDALQRFIKIQKQKQKERGKQAKANQISERYFAEKMALGSQKKRLSLPYSSSNSIHLPVSQKSILKQGRPSGSKPKKHPFVTIPGQGSEILIQHLMSKASINK